MTRRDRGDVSAGRGSLRTGAAGAGADTRRNDGTVCGESGAVGVELGAAERGAATGTAAAIDGMRDVAALSSTVGLDRAIGIGGVPATGAAVALARGGGVAAATGGSLMGATEWGAAGGAVRIVVRVAVRGAAGDAVRGAAGVRVRRGAAGNVAAVSRGALSGAVVGTSAAGVVVARRRTGFGAIGVVGVAPLVAADSAAGLRLRGGFGRSGSSMHEV